MSIGANILAPWVDDRARMYHYLTRLKPALVVVCDEPAVAAQIKAALPATLVVHRWVRAGDGSIANWTPDQWVRDFVLPLPPGVAGYVLNEVGGDWRANADWLVRVMRLVAPLNIPLVLGNFSKGNPPKAAIYGGELDALLLAFNEFPNCRFGYHPYWTDDPDSDEHANWHVHILARAQAIGAHVRLAATEAGRDERGGYDDGYRRHFSSAVYAEKQTRQARRLAAAGIPNAPFCYGKGAPETVTANAVSASGEAGSWLGNLARWLRMIWARVFRYSPFTAQAVERFMWEQFDWQNDTVVQEAFVAFNAQEGDMYKGPPGWREVRTKAAGVRVNVRSAASISAPVVTTVATGDWLRPSGTPVRNGAYTWQRVTTNECATGHVALEVIELV